MYRVGMLYLILIDINLLHGHYLISYILQILKKTSSIGDQDQRSWFLVLHNSDSTKAKAHWKNCQFYAFTFFTKTHQPFDHCVVCHLSTCLPRTAYLPICLCLETECLQTAMLDTIQYFLRQLDMKAYMQLLELSIFSLHIVIYTMLQSSEFLSQYFSLS